jgi:hypothetical protein
MPPGRDHEPPLQDQEWGRPGSGVALAVALGCLVWCGIAVLIWRLVRL